MTDSTSLSDVDVAVKLPAGEVLSIREKAELALDDLMIVREAFVDWLKANPHCIDTTV